MKGKDHKMEAKIEELKEDLQKDKRFKVELIRIKELYKDMREDKKQLCYGLFENAAFMSVLLEDLREDIKRNGYVDTYQNGQFQCGTKRSISADLYQAVIKNYTVLMKMLNDLLPKEAEYDDGFDEFVASRDE